MACGWSWRTEAGQEAVSGPSTAAAIASAFAEPVAISSRWRARRMVPSPWVRTWWGTSSSEPKNRALSRRVCSVSVLIRVVEDERRAGLVEGQVAVAADAEHLEVDAAGLGELRLVGGTGGRHVGRVRAVHPVGGQAQVVGQLAGDRGPVGLRVTGRQADVLVEQERPHLVVRRPGAGPVPRDQLGVRRHGGRAGGQPQHRRRAGADQRLDRVRGERGHLGGGGERDDLHYERAQQGGADRCDRIVVRDHPDPAGQVERGEERRGGGLGAQGVGRPRRRSGSPRWATPPPSTTVRGSTVRRARGRRSATPAANRSRTSIARGSPAAAAANSACAGGTSPDGQAAARAEPGGDGLEAAALAALADRAERVDRHVADLAGGTVSRRGAGGRRAPARRPGRCRC